MSLGNAAICSGGLESFLNVTPPSQSIGGTVTNGVIEAGRLVALGSQPYWTADTSLLYGGIAAPAYVELYRQMTYETPLIDSTVAIPNSRLTLDVEIIGETVAIDYRFFDPPLMWSTNSSAALYGADNDPFYDLENFGTLPYTTWPGTAVATGRTYQFRFRTGAGSVRGTIGKCRVLIDVPDLDVRLNDYPILAGGSVLPFQGRIFSKITTVLLTLQSDGGTAVRAQVIQKSITNGVFVVCYDANSVAVRGTVDAIILGY
jgi:hypothetical protein